MTSTETLDETFQENNQNLDEFSPQFVEWLVGRIIHFSEVLSGHTFHSYQRPFAERIVHSVLVGDGDVITALASRQSGKSEIVTNISAALMVLLPRLARFYPSLLGKFSNGFWIGMFAPVEGQAETVYSRTVTRLTSERAKEIMEDPEIDDVTARSPGVTKGIVLKKSGSMILMMTANPRAKIESKTFHLVIVDECFPAETPILTTEGWVPIGEIVNGGRKDWIVATQNADSVEWAHVTVAYRTPRHTPLVRVDHEYGSVYATANHPFMVGSEEVSAISLTPGSVLSVVPGINQPGPVSARPSRRDDVLLSSVPGSIPESDGTGGRSSLSVLDPEEDWTPTLSEGREWSWADRATATALGRFARRLGRRACLPYWRTNKRRASNELQDRYSEPGVDGGRGNRRRVTRVRPETDRPAEGPMAVRSRVVGVEVLEPGSPEFDQFSDRADYVYTLEVDSESHTYFAGGVAVKNCQDADDYVLNKSIAPMLAYSSGTMVLTGTPDRKKNYFYKTIQLNKRLATTSRKRPNHFQWDWKAVAKVNKNYGNFIKKEMLRIGEDSDEFQMCVAPDTRVLTADLRHVPASEVHVGMELVGFDEHVPSHHAHRKFKTAVVEAVSRPTLPSYRIVLSDGTSVVASEDHLWLVRTSGSRTEWRKTKDLASKRYSSRGELPRIIRATSVWDEEPYTYERGYLAAAFEGEGHLSSSHPGQVIVGFSQKEGHMLQTTRKYLNDAGYLTTERTDHGVTVLCIAEGSSKTVEFLGRFRPQRLVDKFLPEMLGSLTRRGTSYEHPRVESVEYLGEQETVAFRTSTRTFVAEGLASHNSYMCRWMLDRGMFITESVFEELGDTSQQIIRQWHNTPVIVGIDPARKHDSTVCTVLWVDWDRPDQFGYFDHRVLNWLEIQGDDWESQYYEIVNFLASYDVLAVGVDSNGVGDAVAERFKLLLPRAEVIPVTSSQAEQSKRWKHLQALIQRGQITWPAHAKTRRLKAYQRFMTQMLDAEKQYKGQFFTVAAPEETGAHDDFVDSLAIACSLTQDMVMPEVEVGSSDFLAM